jgi:hypothetical protein
MAKSRRRVRFPFFWPRSADNRTCLSFLATARAGPQASSRHIASAPPQQYKAAGRKNYRHKEHQAAADEHECSICAPHNSRESCVRILPDSFADLEFEVPATPPSATPGSEGYRLRMVALHRGASAPPPLKGGGFPLERWPPYPQWGWHRHNSNNQKQTSTRPLKPAEPRALCQKGTGHARAPSHRPC